MSKEHLITVRESRAFRRGRLLWPVAFVAVPLVGYVASGPWVLALSLACYSALTVYLLFWRCPRCAKFYSLKFSFLSAAWPYFNKCRHCGSQLERSRW